MPSLSSCTNAVCFLTTLYRGFAEMVLRITWFLFFFCFAITRGYPFFLFYISERISYSRYFSVLSHTLPFLLLVSLCSITLYSRSRSRSLFLSYTHTSGTVPAITLVFAGLRSIRKKKEDKKKDRKRKKMKYKRGEIIKFLVHKIWPVSTALMYLSEPVLSRYTLFAWHVYQLKLVLVSRENFRI